MALASCNEGTKDSLSDAVARVQWTGVRLVRATSMGRAKRKAAASTRHRGRRDHGCSVYATARLAPSDCIGQGPGSSAAGEPRNRAPS